MTKQQEVDILSATIKQLGPDSYLGPWLSQIKASIIDLVKNDIFPDITLNSAIAAADSIKLIAQADGLDIVAVAQLKADRIEKAADRHASDIASKLYAAIQELTKF